MDYPYFSSGSSADVSRAIGNAPEEWIARIRRHLLIIVAMKQPKAAPSGHRGRAHPPSECTASEIKPRPYDGRREGSRSTASSCIVALFSRDFFPGFTARWQQKLRVKRIRDFAVLEYATNGFNIMRCDVS